MQNSIRWLLTEARLSNLDTNRINFIDGKLICYHLTSKESWLRYNKDAKLFYEPSTQPDKEVLPTDTRAQAIVKRISRPQDTIFLTFNPRKNLVDVLYTKAAKFK